MREGQINCERLAARLQCRLSNLASTRRLEQPMQSVNLTHHFLIAMPNMADPHFSKTLTFICEHNDKGALGVVVNRPIEMNLQTLLEQVSIPFGAEQLTS